MKRIGKDRYRVIYPQYLDSRRSRQEGRRVPRPVAVPAPKESEFKSAAEDLKFRFEIQPGKSYPKTGRAGSFRMLVFTAEAKSRVIGKLSRRIAANRSKTHKTE